MAIGKLWFREDKKFPGSANSHHNRLPSRYRQQRRRTITIVWHQFSPSVAGRPHNALKICLLSRSGALSLPLCLRSEEHTYELQSLMRISYAVFCLNKKKHTVCRNTVK